MTLAPRPIWSGVIAFGLVTVPVRLFSAVHEHKLEFHLVHEKDDGPIGYQKVCKLDGKPVADNEIVKAFELSPGKLVHLTDEDFEAVQIEGQHAIDLEDFVPYDEIDPTFFAHTYLVGPGDGAEKTYALLVRAMAESGLAGIGKFVMRNRQYLGCLRVRGKALTSSSCTSPTRSTRRQDRAGPAAGRLRARARMALDLIEGFSGNWQPTKYKDTYTAALRRVIKAKAPARRSTVPRRSSPRRRRTCSRRCARASSRCSAAASGREAAGIRTATASPPASRARSWSSGRASSRSRAARR